MGLFEGIDIEDVPDSPNELPDNTYLMRVKEVNFGLTKSKERVGMTFRYKIAEGPWSSYFDIIDWFELPVTENGSMSGEFSLDEAKRMLASLKQRLTMLGYSLDEIKAFDPNSKEDRDALKDRKFWGTTKLVSNKDTGQKYAKIVKFSPYKGSEPNMDDEIDF